MTGNPEVPDKRVRGNARRFGALRRFIEERVRTHLRRKHRHRTRAYQAFPCAGPWLWPGS